MDESKVKIAVIGLGYMGQAHIRNIATLGNTELTAVCCLNCEQGKQIAQDNGCEYFADYNELLKRKVCDAVLISTPHYHHTTIGIDSLKAGYHVLVEKPLSVHKADCERLISAHTNEKQIFAAMFNQRTDPHYKKIKELIGRGELGEFVRVNWIMTDWFRTNYYYNCGSWRASWAGEGGGVLINQCMHQLDLLIWLCGMPKRVRGFCGFGKYHDIEVEDEATAYLEYPNGATGVFIASTGEAPGTNRLEICGDNGKVVVENGKLTFFRNETSAAEFKETQKVITGTPDLWHIDIPVDEKGGQHSEIVENFSNAILHGDKLIGPAAEGIKSVELDNAIRYSAWTGEMVELPLDGKAYQVKLEELIKNSKSKPK